MSKGLTLVIPAYNEEKYLPETLSYVNAAMERLRAERGVATEVIVVDNVSTDRTAELARSLGARVVRQEIRNIAAVRNAGIREAMHDFAATVDADTYVPPDAFVRIFDALATGKYVGGGVRLRMRSPQLRRRALVAVMESVLTRVLGMSGGMFFFLRDAAIAVGGFPEELLVAEDMTFARKLQNYGRTQGLKFLNLRTVTIRTFDRKDVSIAGSLAAFWTGMKVYAGVKMTKEDLGYWYDPKR